jgi:streptogramin lyase
VNQKGEEGNYPPLEWFGAWDLEGALDLDMASAMCPECNLLLVQADDNYNANLGAAVNRAAELGADVISNSWGGLERAAETEEDSLYYDHPGIPLLFASGDSGYGAGYPSSSPDVISVGGTSLNKDSSKRSWHESAWSGAGSGCSIYEEKPEWQTDTGCANRTTSDVSAVADPKTPVSVYAKGWGGGGSKTPGWVLLGGTSAATPILAGIEARASEAERIKGARLFWEQGPEGKLFDVAEGYNGNCAPSIYLCSGRAGYDGPTGWGTPGAVRPGPPVVGAYEVSNVGLSKATLNGVVNPNGASTTYYFEYGTTTSYGMGEEVGSLSTGTSPVEVSAPITGLTWNTTYHYRIRAVNSKGSTYGADHTFISSRWSVQEQELEVSTDWLDAGGATKGDVSCSSASNCIAVGIHLVQFEIDGYKEELEEVEKGELPPGFLGPQYAYGNSPLALHWDGTKWTKLTPIVPHQVDDFIESRFYDISCTSSTFCMALGSNLAQRKEGEEGSSALVELWNGSEFTLAPAAVPSDIYTDAKGFRHWGLGEISCTSSTFCLATGSYTAKGEGGGSVSKQMTQVWNGTKWEIVANQAKAGAFYGVIDLACTSSTWCIAIGTDEKFAYTSRWNGSKWSTQTSFVGHFEGLTCVSSTSCMAVGAIPKAAHEEFEGLAQKWDGSEWTPTYPGTGLFEDVSCLTASWCIAVGHTGGHVDNNGYDLAPVLTASRWNGSSWTIEKPVMPPQAVITQESELARVSCKGTDCFAIGMFRNPTDRAPLVERLSLPPENLTPPVVSPSATVYEGVPESTTDGTWAGEIGSFSYQWQRCNAEGKECASISGATNINYTPVAADVGKTLVAKVTAGGAGGSSPVEAVSKPTAKVVALGQVSAFSLPTGSHPYEITAGSDGNLWFTMPDKDKIGKVTTSGTVAEYSLPVGTRPYGITAGPDGKIWFTAQGTNRIGFMLTSGAGWGTYSRPAGSAPVGITTGSDGLLWYTNWGTGKVGKFDPCCPKEYTEYTLPSGSGPSRITKGPDGNLWFVDVSKETINKMTTSGVLTGYAVPSKSAPTAITAGLDGCGCLWFTVYGKDKVGKIMTTGAITEYALAANSRPDGIALGPDGNLWVTEWGTNKKIARVTESGAVTEFSTPAGMSHMRGIVAGADNRMWFTAESTAEGGTDQIGAITP